MKDNFPVALQENILALLCFDESVIPLLKNSIDLELFDSSIYRDIALKAIHYYDAFETAIGVHLPDEFEDVLNGSKDTEKGEQYSHVIESLYDLKENVNKEYVLSKLTDFIRTQNLKLSIIKAHKSFQEGDYEGAEDIFRNAGKVELNTFDPGINLGDIANVISCLDVTGEPEFNLGIKEYDAIDVRPYRGELLFICGLPNAGKTWSLIHLAKTNLLLRKKICHISLEMSQEKIMTRYLQSLFSISKRDEEVLSPRFNIDDRGMIDDIFFDQIKGTSYFADPKIKSILSRKLETVKRSNLYVKDFPSGQLSIKGLRAYLDSLIEISGYLPDLLLIDYADLMKIHTGNEKRISLGDNVIQLRGIAQEYNIAVVSVAQFNRSGKKDKVKWLDEEHLAEDFSKMFTADTIISYNQTQEEYERNLARLLCVKSRGDIKLRKVLLSQAYSLGQFALDTALIHEKSYWDMVGKEF